jgi:FAD/FMN-containing dehydrogenase
MLDVGMLREEFKGELIEPGDERYATARRVWNGMVDRRPALIALADLIAPMPFTTLQTASDASYPNGLRNYWKSHYVDAISDDVLEIVQEHATRMTSPLSSFYFQHLGGAISRPWPDTAAFGHRDATFDFTILAVWRDEAEDAEHVEWAREFAAALQPYGAGVYVNNLGLEGADRVRAAYAPMVYQRLVALKDAYDPHNVFRVNQDIRPSGT